MQDPLAERVNAEVAARQLVNRLLDDWRRGDWRDFGRCFTEDANYVTADGTCCRGRDAIEQCKREEGLDPHARASAAFKRVQITHPSPGVAIVYVEGTAEEPGQAEIGRWMGTLVAILTPQGEWLFASSQGMRLPPARGWLGRALDRLDRLGGMEGPPQT